MPAHFNGTTPKNVLLTMEDVAQWKEEAEALRNQVAHLQAQIETIDSKLAAAAVFMGVGSLRPATTATATVSQSRYHLRIGRPMTVMVRELFNDGVRLTPAQIVSKLSEDPKVAERVSGNVNNVYTAIGRLANRDKILVRHEDGSYSLTNEANEPPSGNSAGGSEAGEGYQPSLNINPRPTLHG